MFRVASRFQQETHEEGRNVVNIPMKIMTVVRILKIIKVIKLLLKIFIQIIPIY